MKFEWDQRKAQANIAKHNVSFEEAETVFFDPTAAIFDDEWHSTEERREIIIGYSQRNRLLLVCFTEREGTVIRIISSREATPTERRRHETQTSE